MTAKGVPSGRTFIRAWSSHPRSQDFPDQRAFTPCLFESRPAFLRAKMWPKWDVVVLGRLDGCWRLGPTGGDVVESLWAWKHVVPVDPVLAMESSS